MGNEPGQFADFLVARQRQDKPGEASRAYREAIDADSKFVSAYEQLAILSAAGGAWEDTVRFTAQLLKLDPEAGSQFYFYSAVGNHYLQNSAAALEHAQEAARRDPNFLNPKIHHLIGILLAEKGDKQAAAESLRMYLKLMPSAPDAAAIREQLADLEQKF